MKNNKKASHVEDNGPLPDQGVLPCCQDDDSKSSTTEAADPPTKGDSPAKGSRLQEDLTADLSALRLGQDFAAAVGVKKHLMTVPVCKPSKEWFCRVHPDPDYRITAMVLESKEDREVYLIKPSLCTDLAFASLVSPRLLLTAINRNADLFIWPVKLPGVDGRIDRWNRSAMDAAGMAETEWVRVSANLKLGAYEVFTAGGHVAEPAWPTVTFQEILRIAFRDAQITESDHPVLKRIRGED